MSAPATPRVSSLALLRPRSVGRVYGLPYCRPHGGAVQGILRYHHWHRLGAAIIRYYQVPGIIYQVPGTWNTRHQYCGCWYAVVLLVKLEHESDHQIMTHDRLTGTGNHTSPTTRTVQHGVRTQSTMGRTPSGRRNEENHRQLINRQPTYLRSGRLWRLGRD